ncbi:hypothetical protein RND71_027544 [Anisodus tanguticus]|uniref:TOD1/MUCI70 glycosyltransferase-like domain-containing protein n=1 Tax=Anisodus tanguticus TaxID=243964 RepID=A0AAE1RJ42_9SOLA|nr:hypothetical protein RND71_027544 [Anisodus tanguticus]
MDLAACLKLLPAEELEHLDFPMDKVPVDPIKRLVKGADASVHCGFYSDKGGFRISVEDRGYMESCKAVVSTCAFGGGDDLYQPIGMSESSLKKACFVAFWDEITVGVQGFAGNGNYKYNFTTYNCIMWQQRVMVSNCGLQDTQSQLRRDPLGVLQALLWRSNSVLAISEHGARSSVYDEAKAVFKKNKATQEEVAVQLAQYRQDGLPEDKRFNGKKDNHSHNICTALAEASIIVREHTPSTNMFMCLWFNEHGSHKKSEASNKLMYIHGLHKKDSRNKNAQNSKGSVFCSPGGIGEAERVSSMGRRKSIEGYNVVVPDFLYCDPYNAENAEEPLSICLHLCKKCKLPVPFSSSKQEKPASISSSDSMVTPHSLSCNGYPVEVMGSSRGNSFLHKCEIFDRPFIQKWLKIGNRTCPRTLKKRNLECFAALAIPVKTVEFAWSRVMPSSQPALLVGMQVHEGTDED